MVGGCAVGNVEHKSKSPILEQAVYSVIKEYNNPGLILDGIVSGQDLSNKMTETLLGLQPKLEGILGSDIEIGAHRNNDYSKDRFIVQLPDMIIHDKNSQIKRIIRSDIGSGYSTRNIDENSKGIVLSVRDIYKNRPENKKFNDVFNHLSIIATYFNMDMVLPNIRLEEVIRWDSEKTTYLAYASALAHESEKFSDLWDKYHHLTTDRGCKRDSESSNHDDALKEIVDKILSLKSFPIEKSEVDDIISGDTMIWKETGTHGPSIRFVIIKNREEYHFSLSLKEPFENACWEINSKLFKS